MITGIILALPMSPARVLILPRNMKFAHIYAPYPTVLGLSVISQNILKLLGAIIL